MELEEKFDNLYIKKRNNLIFYTKFISPYLDRLSSLKINSAVLGFIIGKKTYRDLSRFYEDMILKKVIFYGQPGFEQYCELDNYNNLIKQVYRDVEKVQDICSKHRSGIKFCSIEIKEELDIEMTKSRNYDRLIR